MREFDLSQDDAGEELAESFRERHDVLAPVADLPELAFRAFKADVAFLELPALEAATVKDMVNGTILIGVAASSNPERQRFSLAHELGHLAAGHLSHDAATPDDETLAHAFARHLLLPREALKAFLSDAPRSASQMRLLSSVVEHFQVSGTVAALQLRRVGFVDDGAFAQLHEVEASDLSVRFGWAETRAARVNASQRAIPAQRMVANATEAYIENMLPLQTVAAVEGVSVDELREAFHNAGVAPRPPRASVSIDDL